MTSASASYAPHNNHTPKVSVLMPVYNAERYLAEAVESVLAQTFTDFELIALDDGSTDTSLSLLNRYAAQDDRVYVVSQPNRGVAHTRNDLLRLARGEYVAVLDADDVAMPARLDRQIAYLDAQPEVVCVGSCHQVIDDCSRLLTELQLPEDNDTIQRLALAGHGSICNSASMIRRKALIAVGGYDPSVAPAEDLDVWLKLGEVGLLANLSDVLIKYRLHSNSLSEKKQALQRENARLACERAWQRRGIEGRFEAGNPWRPGPSRGSRYQYMLRYGWWAFKSAQRQTAIYYGIQATQLCPWEREGWKLLSCALFKALPNRQASPQSVSAPGKALGPVSSEVMS